MQLILGGSTPRKPNDPCSAELLARVTGHVQVMVPVFTLARLNGPSGETNDDATNLTAPYACPAELEGYGPIDTTTARRIAGTSSGWDRILTRPHTGSVLAVDPYRPPKRLKHLLCARDQHCRFPGCSMPAIACDIDHTVAVQHGGPTETENLGHLCRRHHTLKHSKFAHSKGWQVQQTART